jgi:site-specific recombinase XerD
MSILIPAALADNLPLIEAELNRDPRLKSVNTKRGYLADLGAFESWRAGRPLSKLLAEEYAAGLQHKGQSPNSINRALAALRWWARRLGDLAQEAPLPEDPAARALALERRREIAEQAGRVAGVPDVKGTRKEKGRHIAGGELQALMAACADDLTPAGARDAAVIALAWATGARRSELAGLRLDDYTPTAEDEGDLSIWGKGDKVRTVYVYDGAGAALADWLTLRGPGPGSLFLGIDKAGHVVREGRVYGIKGRTGKGAGVTAPPGISDEALAHMLAKRRAEAKVKPLTWHDFRRSFAGNLLDNGQDLVTVQKLMGHASPVTTSNYDRRGEEAKRRASRSLHVPYTRRSRG